ncbi:hypothetical protein F5879DRAFT_1023066 [Lentinula edodes]|nr:hypothetical protein F5879DRAFT_1023066 [Lentinula edodes]
MAHDGELGTERTFFVVGLTQVTSLFAAQHWVSCLPEISLTTISQFSHQMFNGPRMDPYVLRLLASLGAGFDRPSHAEIPQVFKIESFSRIHAEQIHLCKIGVDWASRRHEKPMPQYGTPLVTVPALLAKANKELNLNVIGLASTFVVDVMLSVFGTATDAEFSFYLLDVILTDAIEEHFPDLRNINSDWGLELGGIIAYYINDGIRGILFNHQVASCYRRGSFHVPSSEPHQVSDATMK